MRLALEDTLQAREAEHEAALRKLKLEQQQLLAQERAAAEALLVEQEAVRLNESLRKKEAEMRRTLEEALQAREAEHEAALEKLEATLSARFEEARPPPWRGAPRRTPAPKQAVKPASLSVALNVALQCCA